MFIQTVFYIVFLFFCIFTLNIAFVINKCKFQCHIWSSEWKVVFFQLTFTLFLASCNFRHLLITFANSLDPDLDRQNVCGDLDPNCLTL